MANSSDMTTPTTAEQPEPAIKWTQSLLHHAAFPDPISQHCAIPAREVEAAARYLASVELEILDARATIARLEGELEVERMCLAACAVAAWGGEVRDTLSPYDSDSLRAVVALRTRADAAERRVEAAVMAAIEQTISEVDRQVVPPAAQCIDYSAILRAALAAASGDTATAPAVCSECHGDGYITVAVCCGNGHNGECCYDPEPSQEPCPKCSTATTEG